MVEMRRKMQAISLAICFALLGSILAGCVEQQAERVVEEPQALEVGIMCFAHTDGLVDPAKGGPVGFPGGQASMKR